MEESEINSSNILAKQISKLRKEKKWTQKQLAEKLDVTSQVISNWERGYTNPNNLDIANLAKEFNVTADYILFGYSEDQIDKKIGLIVKELEIYDKFNIYVHEQDIELLDQVLDQEIDLEVLIQSDIRIKIDGKLLTNEKKQKILQLIKIFIND